MSEQQGQGPGGTPFAPPGGPRRAPDTGWAADESRPRVEVASPYAPPTPGEATPFAPPAGRAAGTGPFSAPPLPLPPPYGQPGPYGQAGPYSQPGPDDQAPPSVPPSPSPYSQTGRAATPGVPPPHGGYGHAVPFAPPVDGSAAPYGATAYPAAPPAYGVPAGYGPPSYGAPAYPGPAYGYGMPVAPPTDGLAIASLVTSVGGLVVLGGIPGPVGLGLGIGALRRIRRRGTKGRGMAVAGVVVGAVSTLVCVGWVWLAVWASSNPEVASGLAFEEELPDYTLRSDLAVGDCLREYPGSWDLGTADPVDCSEEHALEIVAVLPLPGPVDTYAEPADAGYDRAFAECTAQIERAAPGLLDEWVVWTDVSFPHPDDWASGATTAYCAVATDYPELRGSVLDGSVTGPA